MRSVCFVICARNRVGPGHIGVVEFSCKMENYTVPVILQVKAAVASHLGKESIDTFEVDEYASQVVRSWMLRAVLRLVSRLILFAGCWYELQAQS